MRKSIYYPKIISFYFILEPKKKLIKILKFSKWCNSHTYFIICKVFIRIYFNMKNACWAGKLCLNFQTFFKSKFS